MIFFLFFHENMLWYSSEAPRRGASNEDPQHAFLWRDKKNIVWLPLRSEAKSVEVIPYLP